MTAVMGIGTSLRAQRVYKTFSNQSGNLETLRDVSFEVGDGEFFSIVGPSGCGKSTLLNIIAGLEPHDSGSIDIDPSSKPSSHLRIGNVSRQNLADSRLGRVAYMPQKDLLLPWRTVLDNAALGLELTGVHRNEARRRATDLLIRFGLGQFSDNYPATLSGGMRQRVAFLRTILTEKGLMLLDEPFGALDALTRRSMQEWLLNVWNELRRTVVLITHDVEEAIFLSDRIAIMSQRPGTIINQFEIDLPRPRRADIVTDPAFVQIKRAVLTTLHAGMEGSGHAPE